MYHFRSHKTKKADELCLEDSYSSQNINLNLAQNLCHISPSLLHGSCVQPTRFETAESGSALLQL